MRKLNEPKYTGVRKLRLAIRTMTSQASAIAYPKCLKFQSFLKIKKIKTDSFVLELLILLYIMLITKKFVVTHCQTLSFVAIMYA